MLGEQLINNLLSDYSTFDPTLHITTNAVIVL